MVQYHGPMVQYSKHQQPTFIDLLNLVFLRSSILSGIKEMAMTLINIRISYCRSEKLLKKCKNNVPII